MLVLSRSPGQKVIIDTGDAQIEVSVQEIDGHNIRLGFVAPRSIIIHREEVYRRIARENGEGQPLEAVGHV